MSSKFDKVLNALGFELVVDEKPEEPPTPPPPLPVLEEERAVVKPAPAPPAPAPMPAPAPVVVPPPAATVATIRKPASEKAATGSQVVLIEPERFGVAKMICDELRLGKTVMINNEKLTPEVIKRLYDYVTGAAYALNGKVKIISEQVLVIAPYNVDIKRTQPEPVVSYTEEDDTLGDDYSDSYEY
jgi:cell division inhibitor SepF